MGCNDERRAALSLSLRYGGRASLAACVFVMALATLVLTGCSAGEVDVPAGRVLEVVSPVTSAEGVMVEGGCRLVGSPSDEAIELRPLEYSDPRFFLADRLPDGMTRDDVYYFDLLDSESDAGGRLPCEVNRDTTLPDGFTYLVVDVNVHSHEDERVEFCLADAMLCAYDSTADPGLEFPDVRASSSTR